MDNEAIPSAATTTTAPAMPLRMDTVVVFGDSLCDIGKKWKTNSGTMAIWHGDMFVSPTGRFSDCRNWTDFMFEAATGLTMIVGTPEATINLSEGFTSLKPGNFLLNGTKSFQYANYAEGGACGDTPPGNWSAVLGTFSQQVDAFEKDCKTSRIPLGNTLFIIWLGANDLYTANRAAVEMPCVAQQVANTQRQRLAEFVKNQNLAIHGVGGTCKFVFVDLCRPLTSVRYTKRLQDAEAKVQTLLDWAYMPPTRPKWGGLPSGGSFEARTFQARHTLNQAIGLGHTPGHNWRGVANEVEVLRAQVEEIKNLESGCTLFNSILKTLADQNGDRVAEVGMCISEDTILNLVASHKYRLKSGAMATAATTHMSANSYSHSGSVQHIVTIDEVHPTDQMYKLIWLEIYEQIKRSNCTFGNLTSAVAVGPTTLAELSVGPRNAAVMNQIGASPQARLRKTGLKRW